MRRFMDGSVLLLGVVITCASLACCPPLPKHTGEVPVPPEPTAYVQPPAPMPEPPPPPKVVEAPPPKPVTPPPVPPRIVKAIEDLDKQYPGLFTYRDGLFLFNSDITFDSGSAVVKPRAKAALEKLANILSEDEVKDRRMTIIGHTDSDRVVKASTIDNLKKLGKTADNMGLSEARAEAVAAVLQSGGVEGQRMVAKAKGATDPIADNKTPEGKARNRRVEIYLTPIAPITK